MLRLRINTISSCCIILITCFFQFSISRNVNVKGSLVCENDGVEVNNFGATVRLKHDTETNNSVFRERTFARYNMQGGNDLINSNGKKFGENEHSITLEIQPINVDLRKCPHTITATILVSKIEEQMRLLGGRVNGNMLNITVGRCNFAKNICSGLNKYGVTRNPVFQNPEEADSANNPGNGEEVPAAGPPPTQNGADPVEAGPGAVPAHPNANVPQPAHAAGPMEVHFVLKINAICGSFVTKPKAVLRGDQHGEELDVVKNNIPRTLKTTCAETNTCTIETEETITPNGTKTVEKIKFETTVTETKEERPLNRDNRLVDAFLRMSCPSCGVHQVPMDKIHIDVTAPECNGNYVLGHTIPLSRMTKVQSYSSPGGERYEVNLGNCDFARNPVHCTGSTFTLN